MDTTSLCQYSGPRLTAEEDAVVTEFVRATNTRQQAALAALFAPDAQVNDQLRNFWGTAAITGWLATEIVGEQVELSVLGIRKHHDAVIVTTEIRGDFEAPRVPQPMIFDLYFTVAGGKIVRLLVLLARNDMPEPEIRRFT